MNVRKILLILSVCQKTQPLDVSFFRPLNQTWRNSLNNWKNHNTRLNSIPKSSFPAQTLDSMDNFNCGDSIKNNLQPSFNASRIFPINK